MNKKSPVTALERRAYSEVYWNRVMKVAAVKRWKVEGHGFYGLPVFQQDLAKAEADLWLRAHIDRVKARRLAKGMNTLVLYHEYRDYMRTRGMGHIPDRLYTARGRELLAKVRELVGRKPKFANASATTVSWKWERRLNRPPSEGMIYAAMAYLSCQGIRVVKEETKDSLGGRYIRLILTDLISLTPPGFDVVDLVLDTGRDGSRGADMDGGGKAQLTRSIAADWWEEAGELAKATRLRTVGGVK